MLFIKSSIFYKQYYGVLKKFDPTLRCLQFVPFMKQQNPALLLAFIIPVFISCAHLPKGDKAIVTAQQTTALQNATAKFAIDTANTYIRFTGHGAGQNHSGRFHLLDGNISTNNNVIAGGRFTISIASMQIEQPEEIYQTKLKRHLLSHDFFDTANWRTATFELTQVKPYASTSNDSSVVAGANYLVSGNLTLKGVTKNITFPAKIDIAENTLNALANFNIDRTQWGMYYGSDKALGDKFISPQVNIQLNLKTVQ